MTFKYQDVIKDIISGNTSITLEIRDEDGLTVGEMFPLHIGHLNEPEIIQHLTDWRNENMDCFLTQFVATPERTSSWMEHVLFKQNDQLLFLIKIDETLVGHFGFKRLTENDALLDNALRAARNGHPKLFTFAGKELVNWLIETFLIERIYAYVLAENVASIMMNKQIGFKEWHKYPLSKESSESGINWKMGAKNQLSPESRYCYKSEIITKNWDYHS